MVINHLLTGMILQVVQKGSNRDIFELSQGLAELLGTARLGASHQEVFPVRIM